MLGLSLSVGGSVTETGPPRPRIFLDSPPRITGPDTSGRFRLGSIAILGPDTWDTAVQWQRDGVAIPGATGTSYLPTAADSGADLQVLLRVFSPGYVSLAAYSNSIALPDDAWQISVPFILSAPAAPARPTVSNFFVEV